MKTKRHFDIFSITSKQRDCKSKNLLFEQQHADLTFINKSRKSLLESYFKLVLVSFEVLEVLLKIEDT